MSRLQFRHLRLRAETARGRFGADIELNPGLMVIRADNSRGKSTAVKGMLYALGLERMITARPQQALTSAMRDRLIYDVSSKAETPVLSSWVSLEIEGRQGNIATLTRWGRHETVDSGLVRVTHGPAMSAPDRDYRTQDFYVGRGGAAVNPRGFHRWLASFIGWELPELPTTDGRTAPLYMEQIFPLLFVEQRRGWGGIQAQMPYFSGVSDVRRRALEFLVDLDVGKIEAERLRLRSLETKLQESWRSAVQAFEAAIQGQGLVTVRLPQTLTVTWPPEELPFVAESRDSDWVPLSDIRASLQRELNDIDQRSIPKVQAVETEAESRLATLLQQVDNLRDIGALMREEILRDRGELRSVRERLDALREDLREHQDIVTLQRLGSEELERLHEDCPVCHQQLPASLLGGNLRGRMQSPSDTVLYIKQQIELFEVMERDTLQLLNAKEERLAALRTRSGEANAEIRALRTSLRSPVGTPSIELITRQVQLRDRAEKLRIVDEKFIGLLGNLNTLADQGKTVQAALRDLPRDRLSTQDRSKLDFLGRSFIEQLRLYDFGSFSDEQLRISTDDYLPRREEFDLQADISASDSIRVIWAYLLGLMEVSGQYETNHPGLLVLDEPRQQSAKALSFKALLERASQDASGKQVIFATSEELGSLRSMLEGLPHTLRTFDDFVLSEVSE